MILTVLAPRFIKDLAKVELPALPLHSPVVTNEPVVAVIFPSVPYETEAIQELPVAVLEYASEVVIPNSFHFSPTQTYSRN